VLEALATSIEVVNLSKDQLVKEPAILQTISKQIDQQQKDFSKYERVRKFALLTEPFTVENGELTPKLSIKRSVVEKKYKQTIESLYR
jgi:long-chain acyl-CoA synthetase